MASSGFPLAGSGTRLLLLMALLLGAVFVAGASSDQPQNVTGSATVQPFYQTANANGLSGNPSKAAVVFGNIVAKDSKIRGAEATNVVANKALGTQNVGTSSSCRWTNYNVKYAPNGYPFCKCAVSASAYQVLYYGYYCYGGGYTYAGWTSKYPIKYYKTFCYKGSIGVAVCY